jgi:hypothetical protein
MRQMSHSELSRDELESLRELTHGSVRRRISSAHAVKLVELGYARETADGVAITQLGRAVLASSLPDWPAGAMPRNSVLRRA